MNDDRTDREELRMFVSVMMARKDNILDVHHVADLYKGVKASMGKEQFSEYVRNAYRDLQKK